MLTGNIIERIDEEVDILDRHLQVFKTVKRNEPIGIVKTSNKLGYPYHKVRYSLRILEEAGLIEPTTQAAVTTDQAEIFVNTLTDNLNASIDRLHSMKLDGIRISDEGSVETGDQERVI